MPKYLHLAFDRQPTGTAIVTELGRKIPKCGLLQFAVALSAQLAAPRTDYVEHRHVLTIDDPRTCHRHDILGSLLTAAQTGFQGSAFRIDCKELTSIVTV